MPELRSIPALLAAALLAAALVVGCESTPLTAPTDGTIKIVATPSTVFINVEQGQTEAQSTISAQVLDASGRAVIGAEVIFATTGGTLASGGPPNVVETDNRGIAIDVLTLGLNDPANVDVGATSGALTETVSIIKNRSDQPTAVIRATPQSPQEADTRVSFDAAGSLGTIRCYQWELTPDPDTRAFGWEQGPNVATIQRTYPLEGPYNVVLRVSDDPDAATWCTGASLAPSSRFSPAIDSIDYQIVCDLLGPTADAGSDQTVTSGTPVMLDGSGSMAGNSPISDYDWDCGNGTAPQPTADPAIVRCTYTTTATRSWNATLTVTTDCGDTDTDTTRITVNP